MCNKCAQFNHKTAFQLHCWAENLAQTSPPKSPSKLQSNRHDPLASVQHFLSFHGAGPGIDPGFAYTLTVAWAALLKCVWLGPFFDINEVISRYWRRRDSIGFVQESAGACSCCILSKFLNWMVASNVLRNATPTIGLVMKSLSWFTP